MRNITGTHLYPTAVVTIELDGQHYEQEVAVSNQSAEDALLGVDVSMWPHFIKSLSEEEMAQVNSNVGAARRVLLCSDYLSSGETENLKYS